LSGWVSPARYHDESLFFLVAWNCFGGRVRARVMLRVRPLSVGAIVIGRPSQMMFIDRFYRMFVAAAITPIEEFARNDFDFVERHRLHPKK